MKLSDRELVKFPGKLLWLASYPKSGNTWFRSFMSALFVGDLDINNLLTNGLFSIRILFDQVLDIDSRFLSEREVKNKMPVVYRYKCKNVDRLQFVKAHDAYVKNSMGEPIFPADVSYKVVYIVRNPLDIVGSLAHHQGRTIDQSIELINNPNGYLAEQKNGLNDNYNLPQLLTDWSSHVRSWLEQKEIEVILLKYEDAKENPIKVFKDVMNALEMNIPETLIEEAVRMTSFDQLKKAEETTGFKEKSAISPTFFRKGISGGWKEELTSSQIERIIDCHHNVMKELGYLKDL